MREYILLETSEYVPFLDDFHKEELESFKFPQIAIFHSTNSYKVPIVITEKGLYSIVFFNYIDVKSLNFKYLL